MRGVGVTKVETITRQGRKSYIVHRPQVAGFRTMLRAVGTDTKGAAGTLAHTDIQTTLNTYTQALAPAKSEAQSKVGQMVL